MWCLGRLPEGSDRGYGSNLYKMILNQLSEKGKDREQKTCDEEVESILETLIKGTGGSELKMYLKMSEGKTTGAW